ncbi:MAG: tetratricopeptide repeat protein [Verrucomicrobiota bacterium]
MEFSWSRFPSHGSSGPSPRRRRLILGAAFVVFALGAGLGLRHWVAVSERRNAREAEAAFLDHNFQRTQMLLEQAVQVNPRNLAARRSLAEFYERANPPLALARWREAVALEPERDEARLGLAGSSLRLGEVAAAREALSGVSAAGRDTAGYQRLAAGVALLADDRPGLEAALAHIAQLEPGDLRAQFNLAATQLGSPDSRIAATGRAALIGLARSGALTIRATLELMRAAGRTPSPEVAWGDLAREIGANFVGLAGRLALVRHMQAQPAPQAGDVAALLGGMRELGLASEALVWLDGLDATLRAAPEVRTAQADSVAYLRDWRRLQPLVLDGAWGAAPTDAVTLAFAARVQHEGAGASRARATWDDALDLARPQLSALRILLRLSEAWGWADATKAALWRIANNFPAETSAWRALAAGADAEDDSTEAGEVARSWAQAQPGNTVAQARRQWLAVLDNTDTPALQAAARGALTAADGSAPESLAAGALLLHRAGRTEEALAALARHEPALAGAPRAALAYGWLLAQAGRGSAAERWLALAGTAKLLPKERALLEQAKARPAAPRSGP